MSNWKPDTNKSIWFDPAGLRPSPTAADGSDSRPLVGTTRTPYEHTTRPPSAAVDYPTLFEVALIPRCYLCDTPNALQAITVGKRAGKHICGGCLDGALRSVDGD